MDSTNITLAQEWHIGEPLGGGGFGRVFQAQSVEEPSAVAKFVPKAPGAERELLFENPDGMPNVVPILDKGEWAGYWVLVMPRADESLEDYMEEMEDRLSNPAGGRLWVAEYSGKGAELPCPPHLLPNVCGPLLVESPNVPGIPGDQASMQLSTSLGTPMTE